MNSSQGTQLFLSVKPPPRTLRPGSNPLELVPAGELVGRAGGENGFTRLEACVVLAVLALLAAIAVPALAGTRSRSDRVVCANHLRQVGAAFLRWGHDHGDALPFEIKVADGGTFAHPLSPNAWLHFSWISNELQNASVLACPSDATVRPARDFSGSAAAGGFLGPGYRNQAASYFLSHQFAPSPSAILAGDRNIRRDQVTSCSRFISTVAISATPVPSTFGWEAGLHEKQGNLLFFDGRVAQVDNEGFRQAMRDIAIDDSGRLHFLPSR
jgi:prepilin-type processing-associated H-X9-DG protein